MGDLQKLMEYLLKGGHDYPVTSEEAARAIVDALLSDLPDERKQAVFYAIDEWGSERENAVTAAECDGYYD